MSVFCRFRLRTTQLSVLINKRRSTSTNHWRLWLLSQSQHQGIKTLWATIKISRWFDSLCCFDLPNEEKHAELNRQTKSNIRQHHLYLYFDDDERGRERGRKKKKNLKTIVDLMAASDARTCAFAHPLNRLMMIIIMDGDGGSQMDFSLCLYSREMNTTLVRKGGENDWW